MTAPSSLAVVIPIYSQWQYATDCIRSLLTTAPHAQIIAIDDCSKEFATREFVNLILDDRVRFLRNEKNLKLTAVWNLGLIMAKAMGVEYTVVGNSDLLFSPGWYEPLELASKMGYHLVGPVSNAAGVTSKCQGVEKYCPGYVLSDRPEAIADTASALREAHFAHFEPSPINGYCMWARTSDWFSGAYDSEHVFRPVNTIMPSGKRNPTPLMTGNEDELQSRWKQMRRQFAVACGSFVFHYRSVTRGVAHAKGRWLRKL